LVIIFYVKLAISSFHRALYKVQQSYTLRRSFKNGFWVFSDMIIGWVGEREHVIILCNKCISKPRGSYISYRRWTFKLIVFGRVNTSCLSVSEFYVMVQHLCLAYLVHIHAHHQILFKLYRGFMSNGQYSMLISAVIWLRKYLHKPNFHTKHYNGYYIIIMHVLTMWTNWSKIKLTV